MDESLKDCLDRVEKDVISAVCNGRISGRPFAEYANHAGVIFMGFDVLIQLLQVNRLMRDDDPGDENVLSDYEADAILSMMREVSSVMSHRVEDMASWAKKRFEEVEGKA